MNHLEMAKEFLEYIYPGLEDSDKRETLAQIAIAHALVALVEQMRIEPQDDNQEG